ncbi:phage integrase SAM-like domain-containing protein, partial [Arenibacter sp. S6351L]|uniref:phage integrase SAM-like domain-containing protein n=1 Tax=Arenibacter sp. S6351L TaxID=2926407 RepID=UPI001FF4741C|nr:phage integrase SAM-like domain-containing protein [Arenibacter sp. S6351L]
MQRNKLFTSDPSFVLDPKPVKETIKIVYYIKEYVAKIKKLVGKDIKMGTWNKYNYACSKVERYVKWKYKKNDIPIGDLTSQFLIDFEYYLKTEEGQSQVTINKVIQRFRKPIRVAVAEGYLDKVDIPVIVTTPFRSMLTSHFQVSKRTICELSY